MNFRCSTSPIMISDVSAIKAEISYVQAMEHLIEVVQALSLARTLEQIMAIVRKSARELTGADGASFVLRDGDQCYYADEDAIASLCKGQRFPMKICIGGHTMRNRQPVVISDIAVLAWVQYSFDLSPNLSPKRREALNLTPLPLKGRGWGLGLYSMQLGTAIFMEMNGFHLQLTNRLLSKAWQYELHLKTSSLTQIPDFFKKSGILFLPEKMSEIYRTSI
jgi:hypothetical protein